MYSFTVIMAIMEGPKAALFASAVNPGRFMSLYICDSNLKPFHPKLEWKQLLGGEESCKQLESNHVALIQVIQHASAF